MRSMGMQVCGCRRFDALCAEMKCGTFQNKIRAAEKFIHNLSSLFYCLATVCRPKFGLPSPLPVPVLLPACDRRGWRPPG
jgi:hypothetical protein